MHRTNPDLDIILDILHAILKIKPDSVFINSLLQQYHDRGSLSKKQLEGLHDNALKISGIHPGKLATLQAIIMKRPTKYKSDIPREKTAELKDDTVKEQIEAILLKYPQHKRILFFKAKLDNHDIFSLTEKTELEKFYNLLIK